MQHQKKTNRLKTHTRNVKLHILLSAIKRISWNKKTQKEIPKSDYSYQVVNRSSIIN